MNVSDLLNPLPTIINVNIKRSRCISTPILTSKKKNDYFLNDKIILSHQNENLIGKPRSRFSQYEDNIILEGVANRLTWGQISDLLPHRKRATCFNRYRTLQGIRKSRKLTEDSSPTSTYINSPTLSNTSSPPPFHHSLYHPNDYLYQKKYSYNSSLDDSIHHHTIYKKIY